MKRTIIINPNWQEGDPEDDRYIVTYEDEGYTGFLPVQLTIHPPNFVHEWGEEDSEGMITFKSLPINSNGLYKFFYNGGELGPFALGYIPVKRYNSSTEDFDFAVNVPEVEKLIELEPGQTFTILHNKRRKTFELYDKDADSDMDIEETNDQPLIQLQQKQQRKLTLVEKGKTRDANDTSYRNIGEFNINVDIPIYDGYDQSNPYSITQNGSGVISIPQNYEGLGEINYAVNVPQTLVNNYTQPTITTNGTYTIPSGYTGFNNFTVNVQPTKKQISISDFYISIPNPTTWYNGAIPVTPTTGFNKIQFTKLSSTGTDNWIKFNFYIILGYDSNNKLFLMFYQPYADHSNVNWFRNCYYYNTHSGGPLFNWIMIKYNNKNYIIGNARDHVNVQSDSRDNISLIYLDDDWEITDF